MFLGRFSCYATISFFQCPYKGEKYLWTRGSKAVLQRKDILSKQKNGKSRKTWFLPAARPLVMKV